MHCENKNQPQLSFSCLDFTYTDQARVPYYLLYSFLEINHKSIATVAIGIVCARTKCLYVLISHIIFKYPDGMFIVSGSPFVQYRRFDLRLLRLYSPVRYRRSEIWDCVPGRLPALVQSKVAYLAGCRHWSSRRLHT